MLTLFIALAKRESQIGIHMLEESMLSVTKLKHKERSFFSNVIGKTFKIILAFQKRQLE